MRTTFLAGAMLAGAILAGCQGDVLGTDEAVVDETSALASGTYVFHTGTGSNKCVDVNAANPADGTKIQQWGFNGSGAQSFRVESAAGHVRLVNTATSKCMDVNAAGTADGTKIQLWTCNGTAAQAFDVVDAGGGRVLLKNPNSGKCVDVAAAGTTDGTAIQLWTCNGTVAQSFQAVGVGGSTPRDVTFFVVSDTHADPPESYDLRAMARAINAVPQNGYWPAQIGGANTGFGGGRIAAPSSVVFTGDLMGWGVTPTELLTFRRYFEQGRSAESIVYPSYVGLGNHDLDDADRPPALAADYRNQIWSYVDARHKGGGAAVPVGSFDAASHAYSWDVAGVHFVQLQRFPGDTNYGLPSSLGFLQNDLAQRAADGRPVFLFHHYAMDAFGTQDRWWTAAQRAAYRAILGNYNVAAILAGHSHGAMQYTWEGKRVFQVNNAKAENGSGNNDGNGSFAIVHITDTKLEVVTCRWTDDAGHYELVAPFYSGPAKL